MAEYRVIQVGYREYIAEVRRLFLFWSPLIHIKELVDGGERPARFHDVESALKACQKHAEGEYPCRKYAVVARYTSGG